MRAVAVVLSWCVAGTAAANPQAEQLFRDGRAAIKAHDLDAACDLFARSQKLEPSVTTLLNLGDCHEQAGRTASAWDTFLQANALALESSDQRRATEASRRAAALEPKLARLTVKVESGVRTPGLVIRRNGSAVEEAVWNTAVPVDPGDYQIEASAPGRISWTGTGRVAATERGEIVVAPLVVDPSAKVAIAVPIVKSTIAPWPAHVGAIGVLFGAGERENALVGVRGLITTEMPGGQLRAIGSVHYTRYVDGTTKPTDVPPMTDLHTDSVELGVGAEYVHFLVPQFGFGAGLGIGLDLDFALDQSSRPPTDAGGNDAGAWWMLRASPVVLRFARGTIESSLEIQVVRGGDEFVVSVIATVDWFRW